MNYIVVCKYAFQWLFNISLSGCVLFYFLFFFLTIIHYIQGTSLCIHFTILILFFFFLSPGFDKNFFSVCFGSAYTRVDIFFQLYRWQIKWEDI